MAVGSLLVARPARATEIAIQALTGFSTLNLSAGSTYTNKDGGIGLEVRPEIDMEWGALNGGVDLFYQGRFGSNFGSFPLSREGLGIFYYPLGLAIHKVVMDNGVTVNENRFAPFVSGQFTLTTVAVTDTTAVPSAVSFNGLAIGFQIIGGGVIPMGQTWGLVMEVVIDSTLAGGNTSGSSSSALSYLAVSGLVGFSIHP